MSLLSLYCLWLLIFLRLEAEEGSDEATEDASEDEYDDLFIYTCTVLTMPQLRHGRGDPSQVRELSCRQPGCADDVLARRRDVLLRRPRPRLLRPCVYREVFMICHLLIMYI